MPVILSLSGQSRRIMNSRPSVPALRRQKQTSKSDLQSEFQGSQDYTENSSLKTNKNETNNNSKT